MTSDAGGLRLAIVGGGISGISAAFYASRDSRFSAVRLFESSGRLGGVIETLHTGRYLIERAADNFATLIPDALKLSRDAGLEDMLVAPREHGRQAFVLHHGRVQPIPAGFSLMQPTRVWSVLTTPTLSLRGKARLLGEFFVRARHEQSDESLESFASRRLGREAYENLVEPIVSGIFTADPTTLSMQATMPQFLAMERKSGGLIRGHLAARRADAAAAARKASGARYDQFRAPELGMNAWLEQLAAKLPSGTVSLNSPVAELSLNSPGDRANDNQTSWNLRMSPDKSEDFDAVILATPAAVSSKLLQNVSAEAANFSSTIGYASSAVVAMVVNRSNVRGRLDGFGMIVPAKEQRDALAISFTSNKYSGRTPDEEVLLRVFLGGALRPEVMDRTDAQLEEIACREVREILKWDGRANWMGVIRWPEAMPQYTVGHCDRVAQLHTALRRLPRIAVCGAAYEGVGIPQCVRSGRQAVENVVGTRSVE